MTSTLWVLEKKEWENGRICKGVEERERRLVENGQPQGKITASINMNKRLPSLHLTIEPTGFTPLRTFTSEGVGGAAEKSPVLVAARQ